MPVKRMVIFVKVKWDFPDAILHFTALLPKNDLEDSELALRMLLYQIAPNIPNQASCPTNHTAVACVV